MKSKNNTIQEQFSQFMRIVCNKLYQVEPINGFNEKEHDIDILQKYVIDHICYRVASIEEFNTITTELKKVSSVYAEKVFNGRLFNIYILRDPLKHFITNEDGEIELSTQVVEIAHPGGSVQYKTGFQHIELLSKTQFEFDLGNQVIVKSCNRPLLISAFGEDSPTIKQIGN